VATTTEEITTTTGAPPSSGPSGGPSSRLLMDSLDLTWEGDADSRQLQDDDNTSDVSDNDTAVASSTTAPTTISTADDCPCPEPEVLSTFTATLTLSSAADLADLDFDELASELMEGFDVEVVPIIQIGIQYALDVSITEAQCKAAVAVAFVVPEEDVQCGVANGTTATTTTTPASRRLESVQDVTISFSDKAAAADAATSSQDTTAFVDALAAGGDPVTVTATVSEATVTVELAFVVTGPVAVSKPSVASFQTAVAAVANGLDVQVVISDVAISYTRQPCSESSICDDFVDNADEIGCDAEVCTVDETDRCCKQRTATANAQVTRVVGSLLLPLLWNFFC